VTLQSLTRGVTGLVGAAALAGALAIGVMSASSGVPAATTQVAPVVFGVPIPLDDPAADIPTPEQLYSVLARLADPGVSFRAKGYLVEDGIGNIEGRTADAIMRDASAKGLLPLSFHVSDIAPAEPGYASPSQPQASANVTVSGPGMPATTQNIIFVHDGGWKLSRISAAQVLQMFSA
jgi:hypothetical protein